MTHRLNPRGGSIIKTPFERPDGDKALTESRRNAGIFLVGCMVCLLGQGLPVVVAEARGGERFKNPADPWEGFNRKIFAFNDGFDRYLFLPIASAYRYIMPTPLDQGVTNFFTNFLMPITICNDLFQLKFRAFGSDLGRFAINSTVGVLGFIDVATRLGLEQRREDFGQTLGYWGMHSGPYLVLPFLGGRTVRDAFGMVPDWYLSLQAAIDSNAVRYSLIAVDLVDTRADLIPAEQLITGDRYVFLRDAYLQQRKFLVSDGQVVDDFGDDLFEDGGFEDGGFEDGGFDGGGGGDSFEGNGDDGDDW